jgi:hypothetical protein
VLKSQNLIKTVSTTRGVIAAATVVYLEEKLADFTMDSFVILLKYWSVFQNIDLIFF